MSTVAAQHTRIRRKPPPTMDTRYPSPDPTDPFAPLWVLRSRSSNPVLTGATSNDNLRTVRCKASYDLYPSVIKDLSPVSMAPLSAERPGHYRYRSQSTPPTQISPPFVFPTIKTPPIACPDPYISDTPVPSLLTDNTSESDSGSGNDGETTPVNHPSTGVSVFLSSPTPVKLSQIILPKKARSSLASIENPFRVRTPTPTQKRITKDSISPPVTTAHLPVNSSPRPSYEPFRSAGDLHKPDPQPHTPLRRLVTSERTSKSAAPPPHYTRSLTTPTPQASNNVYSHFPPPPPSTHSISSSYVHISSPSISTSFSVATADDAYMAPRAAPRPMTYSHTSPFLGRHRSDNPTKSRVMQTKKHPPSILPVQTEWAIPTTPQLAHAASLPVIAESGLRVTFGSLFVAQRTVVIFIRHFWCPLCQDYISSVTSLANPGMMFTSSAGSELRERVKLVVISNGSHAFIGKYRQLFDMPFSMYTDPSLAVYVALGMGRDVGRNPHLHNAPALSHQQEKPSGEKHEVLDGGYVRHGIVGGIAMVVMRALKIGMPVWEKGGDVGQLGGEFIFGPGMICGYAHRMQSTRGHVPIRDVLEAAGIDLPPPKLEVSATHDSFTSATRGWDVGNRNWTKKRRNSMKEFGAKPTWNRRHSADSCRAVTVGGRPASVRMTIEEELEWMEERMRSLQRLKERKSFRRIGARGGLCPPSENGHCSPVEEDVAGEILVIGFQESQRTDEDMEISPTGATEH